VTDSDIRPLRVLDPSASPPTAAAALTAARARIPVAEARILLCHVLGWSHARLASYPERVLTSSHWQRFVGLVERRVQGEPVAYLTGHCEFYGRPFQVCTAVLVPRAETELLVDISVAKTHSRVKPKILDLGTGSGALAVTLSLEIPRAMVTAVDRSTAALTVALHNAEALGAPVRFLQSDWFDELGGERFDLIVANPPYIAADDPHLSQGDLRYEPASALTDGSTDGLGGIERICHAVCGHLERGGWLWLEHGWDQAACVRGMMHDCGLSVVHSRRDLAGILRTCGGRL
jgi:release factor glutamine methyltransferase